MTIGYSTADNLKLLGTALIAASVGHALLCLTTLPNLIGTAHSGFVGAGLKAAGIIWTIAGVLAGIFVALQALAIFQRRDLEQARLAAVGMLILPFTGLIGGISAFALVPLGVVAFWLLRQPPWYGQFCDFAPEPWLENEIHRSEQPEVVEEETPSSHHKDVPGRFQEYAGHTEWPR